MTNSVKTISYPEMLALVDAATSIWKGSNIQVTIHIAVSKFLKTELKTLLDSDIESVFITDSAIRHIKRTHSKTENKRGQVDIAPADFAALPVILNEFDSITHTDTDKLGNKKFLIIKNMGDSAYVVVIQRGKRKMEIKTFWKTKVSGASC